MKTDHDVLTSTRIPHQALRPRPRLLGVRAALGERFRLPADSDAPPPVARIAGVAIWAAACAFTGLAPAARLWLAMLFGRPPGWYLPSAVAIGVLGMALVAAAFAAIHRARLPWYLLGFATVLLIANMALAYGL